MLNSVRMGVSNFDAPRVTAVTPSVMTTRRKSMLPIAPSPKSAHQHVAPVLFDVQEVSPVGFAQSARVARLSAYTPLELKDGCVTENKPPKVDNDRIERWLDGHASECWSAQRHTIEPRRLSARTIAMSRAAGGSNRLLGR